MMRLTGKIDRLVHNGDHVMIVDYKTNRPPPADAAHVADAYLLQLAAYRLGVRRIFRLAGPGRDFVDRRPPPHGNRAG